MRLFARLAASVFSIALGQAAYAAANSWIAGTGKWESAASWTAGAPSSANAANFITNASTKTVTIDALTSGTFPSTLTISNLTIAGPIGSTNTLSLSNAGLVTPLRILDSLTLDSRGALLVSNSILRVDGLSGGSVVIDGSVTLLNLASMIATNTSTSVGEVDSGSLTINGGTAMFSPALFIGSSDIASGAVWVTGGQLVMTNNSPQVQIGRSGIGRLTVSNGTVRVGDIVFAGVFPGSQGTLTVAGGTNLLSSSLIAGYSAEATGTVSVTGGQLVVTNNTTYIGFNGVGRMTVSGGTVLAADLPVGYNPASRGVLTVSGGTLQLSLALLVGFDLNATGMVFVTGGTLVVTNDVISLAHFAPGMGELDVSNGLVRARTVLVGNVPGGLGLLNVAGGTAVVSSNLVVGDCALGARGVVNLTGGNLFVTNAAGNAMLEVRSGTVTLTAGQLKVDQFVMTNSCASFIHPGGTLIYGQAVLDPARDDDGDGIPTGYEQAHGLDPLNAADANLDKDGDGQSNLAEYLAGTDATNSASAFRITAIARVANTDILVTWTMGSGKTNALQRTAGTSGSYATNSFADIFTVTNTVGSTTNYVDVGGATNSPSLYYRIRLVDGQAVLDPARDDDGDGIPTGYEQAHGLDPLNPADANLDKDGDGQSNLAEYLAGTDPTSSASAFRITAIARVANTNILVTWTMGSGKTNALQRTAGTSGSYATNSFADIFTVTNTVGSVTNYLDVGAATNSPARYYRVRLVP